MPFLKKKKKKKKKQLSILTHHLYITQTLENQKYIVTLCVHHQILLDEPIGKFLYRIPKRAVILISKSLWKFLELQRI